MTKEDILTGLLYDISDEIGTDISYTGTNQNGYQYLTGMDFGLLLAAGISSTFFVPLISGFASRIGEALAETAIAALKNIISCTKKQLKERDNDNTLIIEFIHTVPSQIFSAAQFPLSDKDQENLRIKQTEAIKELLEDCSFPQEKAQLLSTQILEIMNDAMEDGSWKGEAEND